MSRDVFWAEQIQHLYMCLPISLGGPTGFYLPGLGHLLMSMGATSTQCKDLSRKAVATPSAEELEQVTMSLLRGSSPGKYE